MPPKCWRRVARLLARNWHEVFTPTLTPDIIDTHILSVVNEMRWQELNHVVLVGHSYGGMVISGVAEKMEKSISSFVMVDAFLPETGKPWSMPPSVQDTLRSAERSGATTFPTVGCLFNVNERDPAWVDAQCTPQPPKCFLQRPTLTRARERIANNTYIRATGYPSQPFDLGMANARAKGWRIYEVGAGTTGCSILPERLADILREELSRRAP
jgi:pimeloyl-ACP methyl ester carboxylesterase